MYPVSDGEYFGTYGNCFLTDWSAGDIFSPSFMEGGHELGSAEVDEPVFCRLYGKIGFYLDTISMYLFTFRGEKKPLVVGSQMIQSSM